MRISWNEKLVKKSQKILAATSRENFQDALNKISEAAGTEVSSDSLSHAFKRNGLASPFSMMKPEPVILDPVQKVEAKEQEKKSAKEMERLVEELRQTRARQSFLDTISSYKAPPKIMAREKKSGVREMTAVVLASDWHVEEPVSAESVAFRNEYNLTIAEERINRFFQGIIWNIEHQRASGRIAVNDLILWLGGDLMTGYIHPELVEHNEMSPTETVRWLLPKLRDGIYTLLNVLDLAHIEIPCSFGNHGRCHDVETELLTRDGWKKYDQIAIGDLVATYHMESGRTEWQPLTDVYVKPYDGPMVKVDTSTADFMVTPHHRMVVRSKNGPDQIIEMQEFVKNGTMGSYNWPKCAAGNNKEYTEVSDDELRILGWIVTDGTHATTSPGKRAIRIYQSKEHGKKELREVLSRLGVQYGEYERTREAPSILGVQVQTILPDTTFSITVESSQRFLSLMPNKRQIPEWMNELSTRQFNLFLEGLLGGDGNVRNRNGSSEERVIYGDEDVISSIQTICVTNGIPARVRIDNRGNGILSLPNSVRGYINDFEKSVKTVHYTGDIWCGTVENGTLITRRNGIPLVSGNTTDKPRISTGYSNSFEWLMYHSLADEFRKESRIHFEITNSSHQYVQVYDKTLHFHHGDDLKYMGGVGGLAIPLLKAIPMWDMIKKCDVHNIGHFHQLSDFGRAVVNGSMIGYGPYSQRIRAAFEVPAQAFYYIDSARGKCMMTALWLDDEKKREAFALAANSLGEPTR